MVQPSPMSAREQEVINLLLEGKSNKLIAAALGISDRTVEFHLKNIYSKAQVRSRTELILKLGRSTGADKGGIADDLGHSTVAETGESPENKDKPDSGNWVTSLREAVSRIGKELKMESFTGSEARTEGSTLTFFEAIRVCLTKYADFNGRASRSEFWWFALFITLVSAALVYVSQNVSYIFQIAVLLPFLAAGTRRLHDIGKSGWWQLFLLAPIAGLVVLGIWWAQPTDDMPSVG
jgi:DNA-binding CsgD family transcriptional regulator